MSHYSVGRRAIMSRGGTPLRRSARLLTVSATKEEIGAETSMASAQGTLKRKHVGVKTQIVAKESVPGPDDARSNLTAESPVKRPAKKRKKMTTATETEVSDEGLVARPKRQSLRKPKPEPLYIIPEVETKETSFRGRLGYACLNTVLRNKKPASEAIFCSRTCRIESIKKHGIEWVKSLGRKNVEDLLKVIQWNEDNNIRFFRISSEIFPFASHEKYGYSLDYSARLLAEAGALARKYGHRLTTHPGQYTQLGSPKPAVVEAARRELAYHCQMLDLMGMGPDSVMVVHGGGVYGDKSTTLERLKQSISILPTHVRSRIVLENDEICYNAEDLLPLCEELNIPLVFDYHHDALYPSIPPQKIIERADAIWRRRGIRPKQHLSEQRLGAVTLMERRAHADRCENLPAHLPDDMDLMIEAKDKEQAVLYLHRRYKLQPVVYDSLRPANPDPSPTQTMGSNSKPTSTRAQVSKETVLSEENNRSRSSIQIVEEIERPQ